MFVANSLIGMWAIRFLRMPMQKPSTHPPIGRYVVLRTNPNNGAHGGIMGYGPWLWAMSYGSKTA